MNPDRKKISLWAVTTKGQSSGSLTVTATQAQALEYVGIKMALDYRSHFLSWCDLHGEDATTDEAWTRYCQTTLTPEELQRYRILKLQVPLSSVASIFRGYFGCIPLGCSYEDEGEIDRFLNSLDPEFRKQLEDLVDASSTGGSKGGAAQA